MALTITRINRLVRLKGVFDVGSARLKPAIRHSFIDAIGTRVEWFEIGDWIRTRLPPVLIPFSIKVPANSVEANIYSGGII